MADREKVEKGLRICTSKEPCNGCPYLNERNCSLSMVADALALLKEQEPVKPKYTPKSIYSWECGVCAEPFDRIANYCPKCGRQVKWNG